MERSGLHRYRYPEGKPARLLLDLAHRDVVLDASLRVVGPRLAAGPTCWSCE